MKSLLKVILFLGFAFALVPLITLAAPGIPHQFYGTVSYSNGSAVLSGTVKAKIDGVVVATGSITNGKYGYNPNLFFVTDPDSNRVGKIIMFFVNDVDTGVTASFSNGGYNEKNLEFNIAQVEVAPSGLANLLDNGTISVSGTTANANSATFAQIVVINVAVGGETNTVTVPKDTIITKTGGGTFNANDLTASSVTSSSLSGLGTGVVVKGALQWGIASLGLTFSTPITIKIYVGTSLDGQTLNVQRSTTGSSGWTNDGIVVPATCVVTSGYCSFSATQASYYATSQTTTTTVTTTLSAAAQKVDANKDNKIDVLDFNTLMVNWGKTTANNVADFNGDGKVDIFDFNMLMINWIK